MRQIKKAVLSTLLIFLAFSSLYAQKKIGTETPEQKAKRMVWWTNDRFGMFIHWGLYSQAARHEWVKRWERMTNEQYQPYFDEFNPDLFNPKEWAKKAKAAGMKYAVLTTKHHEGFCLFDSRYTDYKATNTAAKRDLAREFVDAFRAEGIKIGFYYSLLDWHHPDFTVDVLHPLQPASEKDEDYDKLNKGRDMARYRTYMHNQIKELLTNYGKIDMLWLDFSYPDNGKHGKGSKDWGSVELVKEIRKLQPNIIIDNRLDINEYQDGWDYLTPEQVNLTEWTKKNDYKTYWETCQTFSGSWGYFRDENSWKSTKQLITMLIEAVSKRGNLLLNVGPTARGLFDKRANERLDGIAAWMKYNSRSVYGCTEAPEIFKTPDHTMLTYNANTKRLYVHLLEYPGKTITLPGYKDKVKYIQFLHDASEIQPDSKSKDSGNDLVLNLPENQPDTEIPVIELILK